jgi:hypothetical protein
MRGLFAMRSVPFCDSRKNDVAFPGEFPWGLIGMRGGHSAFFREAHLLWTDAAAKDGYDPPLDIPRHVRSISVFHNHVDRRQKTVRRTWGPAAWEGHGLPIKGLYRGLPEPVLDVYIFPRMPICGGAAS